MESASPNFPAPEATGTPVTEATLESALRAVWPGLRAYVASMLGPHRRLADDVLQETALWVWEQRAQLPEVRNFDAWVFRAAYFKTLSVRRDLARSKEAQLGDELFEKLAAAGIESQEATEARLVALEGCLRECAPADRVLLTGFYRDRRSLKEMAAVLGDKVNTVHQRVSRLRRALRHCVETKLAEMGASVRPRGGSLS